jgi:leucine dehydrogenase
MLADAGARHLLSDTETDKVTRLAQELAATVVPNEDVYDTPCDVYAPCAVGATLNPVTIPRLQCAIVAGSANNQLESPEDADRLHDRGILYAPDYLINAGGAMSFTLIYAGEDRVEELERRVSEIGGTLQEVFSDAERSGVSPVVAAERRVESVLARGAAER